MKSHCETQSAPITAAGSRHEIDVQIVAPAEVA